MVSGGMAVNTGLQILEPGFKFITSEGVLLAESNGHLGRSHERSEGGVLGLESWVAYLSAQFNSEKLGHESAGAFVLGDAFGCGHGLFNLTISTDDVEFVPVSESSHN